MERPPAPGPTSQPSGPGWLRLGASRGTTGGGASVPLGALAVTQLHRQCMVRGPEPRVPGSPSPQCSVLGRGVCFHDCSEQPLQPKIVCAWELGSQHIPPGAGAGCDTHRFWQALQQGAGDLAPRTPGHSEVSPALAPPSKKQDLSQ